VKHREQLDPEAHLEVAIQVFQKVLVERINESVKNQNGPYGLPGLT